MESSANKLESRQVRSGSQVWSIEIKLSSVPFMVNDSPESNLEPKSESKCFRLAILMVIWPEIEARNKKIYFQFYAYPNRPVLS